MTARFASPAARDLAAELGIDPETVTGTGRDGAITVADVRAAMPDPPPDLGEAGARLWRDVLAEFEPRADELRILLAACRTLDELTMLDAAIREAPATVAGSKGQVRPHPLFAEVRAHRLALRQLLESLRVSAAAAEATAEAAAEGVQVNEHAVRSHAGRQLAMQRWSPGA